MCVATLALSRVGREEWKARPSAAWAGKDTAGREASTGARRVAAEIRSEAAVSWAMPEKRRAILLVSANFWTVKGAGVEDPRDLPGCNVFD